MIVEVQIISHCGMISHGHLVGVEKVPRLLERKGRYFLYKEKYKIWHVFEEIDKPYHITEF